VWAGCSGVARPHAVWNHYSTYSYTFLHGVVCCLSHLCTLLKWFNGFRCHLEGPVTPCIRRGIQPQGKEKFGVKHAIPNCTKTISPMLPPSEYKWGEWFHLLTDYFGEYEWWEWFHILRKIIAAVVYNCTKSSYLWICVVVELPWRTARSGACWTWSTSSSRSTLG